MDSEIKMTMEQARKQMEIFRQLFHEVRLLNASDLGVEAGDQMIKDGIEKKDAELAFRGAHTLKGVCSNLGFSKLCDLSSQLTEILRGRELEGYEAVLAQVEKQYQITVEAIRELGQ